MTWQQSAKPADGARLGQHVLSVAEDASSQLDLVAAMFRAGLDSDCQCLYVSDRTPPRAVVAGLRDRGCEIEEAVESGQFVLATADELYIRHGQFDPDRMLEAVAGAVEGALKAGSRGWCGSGELGWAGRSIPGTERLLEYEFGLNYVNGLERAAFVCLYDGRTIAPSLAAELGRVHPFSHRDGHVACNEAFVADRSVAAELPLLEDLEPPADTLPCRLLAELISAAADGELLARRRQEMDSHLAACTVCSTWAETVRELKQGIRALCAATPAPDELLAVLRSRVRSLRGNG